MYFPDLGTDSQVASGPQVRAIGWLDDKHPFRQGSVDPRFVPALKRLLHPSMFVPVAAAGPHCCELCQKHKDASNLFVPAGDLLYVAPAMVVHYIDEHRYQPPSEFVAAVLNAPIPGTSGYTEAYQPFLHIWRM